MEEEEEVVVVGGGGRSYLNVLNYCLFFLLLPYSVQLKHYEDGLFWCFHNPPNSDMDYRIFNVRR